MKKYIKTFENFEKIISKDELEDYKYLESEAENLFDDYKNNGGYDKIAAEKSIKMDFDIVDSAKVVYDDLMKYLIDKEWYEDYNSEQVDTIKNIFKSLIRVELDKK